MSSVKLAITADLHLPITRAEQITSLAQEMAGYHPDAAVLAGDLAESLPDLERCLALFREQLSCPIYVLPGNHDLWVRRTTDSRQLWLMRLPQAVAAAGCHWLEGSAFVLRGTAVAGTIAWYDYSAADPSIQATALTFSQEKYNHNPDALLIDWEWSDPEFAELVAAPFLATLDRLEDDPAVSRIVVVSHVPLAEGQLIRNPANRDWAFSNAYWGNLALGHKVLARRKVSHIISGHVHADRACRIDRPGAAPVEARVVPSDYEKPAWLGLAFEPDPGALVHG
jgi:3',5'-cyclic AMP phosphodiesterase CpdA